MTPKQRLLAALHLQQPDVVPTMEIDFQLHQELLGDRLILGEELASLQGAEKNQALNHNVDVYLETAERLDYSAVTVHPIPTPAYTPEGRYYPELEDEL